MISVLYVDDERDLLEIAKTVLEETGEITIEKSTSAKEALNLLKTNKFDAIISDYQMPVMDGITFLKEVRLNYGQIPFILFTGRGREEIAILALNSGADFYIQKGGEIVSQFAELKNKIEKAVREYQSINALRNSERKLADIIDFLPDATFAIDRQGHVISWNRAMEEMTGISANLMVGKGNYEYSIPFYGERHRILIDQICNSPHEINPRYLHVLRTGSTIAAETSILHRNDIQKTLWLKASPLYDQNGSIVGAIETIRDVSDRKDIEKKLKKSEERYRILAESSHDLIYIIDRNDTIVYVNTFASKLLQASKEDIIGKQRSEFFPESTNKTQWENIKKVIDTGEPIRIESKVSFKGHDTWQDTQLIPLRNQNGEVIEVMGVTRDLTHRYEAEEKLRKAHEKVKLLISEQTEEVQKLYLDLIQESQKGL